MELEKPLSAAHRQAPLFSIFRSEREGAEQRAPRCHDVADRKPHGIASLDAGESGHGAVPDHHVGVGAERANALWEIFENLAKIALKGLELGGCTAQRNSRLVEPLLEEA